MPRAGDTPGVPQTQPAADRQPAIKPRLELHVPSVRTLLAEARRSNVGFLLDTIGDVLVEASTASSEGIDIEQAAALITQIKQWPDSSIDAVTYASDTQGRPRWIVRFRWPLRSLHARVAAVLDAESSRAILKDVTLSPAEDGGYKIALAESTLAYLLPAGESESLLASSPDLEFPSRPFVGTAQTRAEGTPLLVCRLNLTQTEKDSGATWLSSFSVVTNVTYAASVNESGDWVETVHVDWPPISGLGAKAVFGKVSQTFFVPDEAFGSLVVNSGLLAPGMLEGLAGLGPQVMTTRPGEFEIVGEMKPGPVASRTHSTVCVTVLPGTGFFPIPDIIVQARAKAPDTLIQEIREAAEEANKLFRDREQPEPWHESKVGNRVVFWNDGSSQSRGLATPASLRAVLFVKKETDAKGRERSFLVIGRTSTSPEELVERWVGIPRRPDRRFLPSVRKTRGQVWVNWRQLYRWLSPWANIGLSTLASSTLLPDVDTIASRLTDASVTVKMRYAGLTVEHHGPVPGGVIVVPALLAVATAEGPSGASDLARERDAARKLKVLHHHAKLFRKDLGRWPAEVAELDGYVDFAGNPALLRVRQSSKKAWSEWGKSLLSFGGKADTQDQDEEEEDDELGDIDDSIYVIEWHEDSWRLGFAPGTFEHLEELYVDDTGIIHRIEKNIETEDAKNKAG
ncbi:MAG: hypothetical protein JSV19_13500 [Phycisphaerales bacterium]|nr:MAG: hypothetical protein JSV19_13500 [Phycisphaerales bacterium]